MRLLPLLVAPLLALPCAGQSAATKPGVAPGADESAMPLLPQYGAVQARLARGWNTWDVNSVSTEVLLPEALAVHVGLKHNTTEGGDAMLVNPLIGRLTPGAEQVTPGPHSWDGSYTGVEIAWKGHRWREETAHDGADLVMLVTPLAAAPTLAAAAPTGALAPTVVISVDYLWNRPGTVLRERGEIVAQGAGDGAKVSVFCSCEGVGAAPARALDVAPVAGPYFATDLDAPVAVMTGHRRTVAETQAVLEHAREQYTRSLAQGAGKAGDVVPIEDAIETTLGWDTIYEPEKGRVVSPVSRVWSVSWGGYVVFDWDTFFAATMAAVGSKDLAYADAIETLRESTAEGFVPNYARAGGWKSSDRSEPPVGSVTVLDLYKRFGDKWLLEQAWAPLLSWNRWWDAHRQMDGYLVWGSNGENEPRNLDDRSVGTRVGAVLESGLDNSPMYDGSSWDAQRGLLPIADVGLMSMYIADCNALAEIAETLGHAGDAAELRARAARYGQKLAGLWSAADGIFLNKDLQIGKASSRLSPTNFYPMLAGVATPEQARVMVQKHLMNPQEFWGEWVVPSIARNDPAFQDQNYWRGRIWGPMNYLVYLGLRNYDLPEVRDAFTAKSYALFAKEWREHGHVHENYNALLGLGDDVPNSDRFYHWGALLGYVRYMEELERPSAPAQR